MTIRINPEDYVTVPTAATELGKPKSTIYRWIKKCQISFVDMDGIPYIPKSEIIKIKNSEA